MNENTLPGSVFALQVVLFCLCRTLDIH